MSNEKEKKAFSQKLLSLIRENGKNQNEVARDLGYAQTTFNNWCIGKVMPRSASDIQAIADYFHVGKSYLMGDAPSTVRYIDEETLVLTQQLKERPDLKELLNAGRKLKPAEITALTEFIRVRSDDTK